MTENKQQEEALSYEEWLKGRAAFRAKYPDMPEARPIETLDLIMKREYAVDILCGRKKVEYRDASSYYDNKMIDKDVYAYADRKIDADDADFMEGYLLYESPVRPVDVIHFHNYANTWYLDVEVGENNTLVIDEDGANYIKERFGDDSLFEIYEEAKKNRRGKYPECYYYEVAGIIDTNLEQ